MSVTPAEKTGARTDEAADVINGARERIDTLDDRIIGLIQERIAVSAVIQEARITSGGRRVNLSREMEILEHYSEALGRPGTSLGMTLLELCRGRI
ncbi:chorismate mutase [Streptomyces sp. NPDC005526]|uniref:chorismate mutase n=1 Tax=Streptomyces sp. NPDC005526 TaxID=3156885 RepID=UPI0033B89B63